MTKFHGSSWTIDLLPEWTGEHDEECSTIYHPNGVGALQISAYSKGGAVTAEDLEDLALEHIEAGAKPVEANTGQFKGFSLAFGVDGEFWQYWYARHGSTALLVTYNCEEADRNREIGEIKEMVATLAAT